MIRSPVLVTLLASLAAVAGCAVDASAPVDDTTTPSQNESAIATDTTPPVFAGVSSVLVESPVSLLVQWKVATDNVTPASKMVYRVCVSSVPTGCITDFVSWWRADVTGDTKLLITGLYPTTKYYVRVIAHDEAFNVNKNTAIVAATTSKDTAPPVFAGIKAATRLTPTSARLQWSAATDDSTPAAQITYDIYMGTSPGTVSTNWSHDPSGVETYDVTDLAPNTTYYFIVRARDFSGNSERNNVEAVTVTRVDTTPPVFAGLVTATASTEATADLSWNAATDNFTPAWLMRYEVFTSTTPGGELTKSIGSTTPGTTTFLATGLTPNTTHYFIVRAVDEAGNVDTNKVERSVKTFPDVIPPTFAGLSTVTALGPSSLKLAWSAATDYATPASAIRYVVYMSTKPGGESLPMSTTAPGVTSFTVPKLAANTTYYFWVRAEDTSGNRDTNTAERSGTTTH